MTNQEEGLKLLESLIVVTPQRVSIAKAFFLKNFQKNVSNMVDSLLQANEVVVPDKVVIHPAVDSHELIKKTAEGVSCVLAGCEAIWGLIASGLLFPATSDLRPLIGSIRWTTVVQGSGGYSGGWPIPHFSIPVPTEVLLSHSAKNKEHQSLSDPDLFLHTMNIPNIQPEVKESLVEVVRCFRHELYLACLAMLGKASEGAWVRPENRRRRAGRCPSQR